MCWVLAVFGATIIISLFVCICLSTCSVIRDLKEIDKQTKILNEYRKCFEDTNIKVRFKE